MLAKQLEDSGLIPVIKLNDPTKAVPLAAALREGGINCLEMTFRTEAARAGIEAVTAHFPDMLVGAGTVLTLTQLQDAKDAGARFIVSPGFDAALVAAAMDMGLMVLPGVVTPTELMAGLNVGLSIFKFFPAENFGGLKTVLALAAPFGNARFVPTGGIDEKNAADYWRCPKVLAIGGSWIASEKLIDSGDFGEITRRTRSAVELMHACRREGSC